MIAWWRQRLAARADDRAVLVTALLDHLGPMTVPELQRYAGGSLAGLYPVLLRLEGAGRVAADWVDGPYPRRRVYQLAWPPRGASGKGGAS